MRRGFVRLATRTGLITAAAAALAACRRPAPLPAPASTAAFAVRDGFEGEALAPFWLPGDHGSGRFAPGAVVLTDERARSGRRCARITVRERDVAQLGDSGQSNERAELDSGARPLLGRDVWCGFSFLVPAEFPIVDSRLVLSQWKQADLAGSPLVAQRFVGGRHYLTIRDLDTLGEWREERDLPRIVLGRWHDLVCRVRFATDASGLVEVWFDGRRVLSVRGATASASGGDGFYHKLGLYRDTLAEPMTVFVDNYALGSSFDAVDPARFGD
jgi:hypothetical protein